MKIAVPGEYEHAKGPENKKHKGKEALGVPCAAAAAAIALAATAALVAIS